MPNLSYSQLKGQLLILEQISNPSPYIVDAIKQIKNDLTKLESEDQRYRLIDKATQEIELIKQRYSDLIITYSIKQYTTSQEERRLPQIIMRPPVQVVTHINALNKDYTFTDPRSVIFKNKEYTGVKFWKDVLETVCNIMQELHPQQINRVLNIRGRSRLYFATNLMQLSSAEAKSSPRKIRNTNIYLETNFSANRHAQTCYRVIELFGYKMSDLNFITY